MRDVGLLRPDGCDSCGGPGPEAKALIQGAMAKASSVSPEQLKERLLTGEAVLVDVRQGSEIPIMGSVLPQSEQKRFHGDISKSKY